MSQARNKMEAEAQTIIDKGIFTVWSGEREDKEVNGVFISRESINSLRRIIRKLAANA